MVLYGTIEWLGYSWHYGIQLCIVLKWYAYFQFSNINQSLPRTTCPLSPSWRMLMVPDWILRTWGHYWLHGSPLYVNLWLMLILNSQAQIVCQEHPVLEFIFGESWRFLIVNRIIYVLGHSWHHGTQLCFILKWYTYFQFFNIDQSLPRTTCPLCLSWRMLMVPD